MASKEMVDAAATGAIDPEISRRWQHELAQSAETREGMSAFLERREPHFTWVPPA
jgi:enoyl-CoA hydratase/carnithine racemase